jgi:deazaflavin-dependent oxidoreductase (nitroreductase family)
MTTTEFSAKPVQVSATGKFAMRGMAFLLRHNLMGKMGNEMMVITVKGRKTGKEYSTPIGFLRLDDKTLVALTNASGESNWYRNILKNPDVQLTVQGKKYAARAEPINDEAERQRIFTLYKQERVGSWKYLFDKPLDSSEAELQSALAKRAFVRFHLQ